MFIKYLGNIHNLSEYRSIIKGGANDHSIQLLKDNDHFHSMEFRDTKARDYFLNYIWTEIEKNSTYFDIDKIIDVYYEAEKYNI